MKIIIEIELEHNGIMDSKDVKYEIYDILKNLKYRHLTSKIIRFKDIIE